MTVSYTTDIHPLFRAQDIACMTPRNILVDQQAWMCDPAATFGFPDHGNARRVFERISADDMPPDNPWPDSLKTLYQNWMIGGFQP